MTSFIPADPTIAEFAAYLQLERGQSPRTSEEYARDVELFGEFLEPGHPKTAPFLQVAHGHGVGRAPVRHGTHGAAEIHVHVGPPQGRGAALVFRAPETRESPRGQSGPGRAAAQGREAPAAGHVRARGLALAAHADRRQDRVSAPPRRRDHGTALCQRHPPGRARRTQPQRRGPRAPADAGHRQGQQAADGLYQPRRRRRDPKLSRGAPANQRRGAFLVPPQAAPVPSTGVGRLPGFRADRRANANT